jgi:hypothetical protein
MFLSTLIATDGTTLFLGHGLSADLIRPEQPSDRYYWFDQPDHHRIIRFSTKADAYRAYQVAFTRKGDQFEARGVE